MSFPLYPNSSTDNTIVFQKKVPPYPFKNTKQAEEIDLRAEMKLMLEGNEYWVRRGHWVLVRNMDQRQRCFCWNKQAHGDDKYNPKDDKEKYNEPQLNCPVCHGEGYVYQDELQLTRRRLVAPEIGLANQEQMSDIGWFNVNYICYYLQYFVNPKKGDKIIEIQLDDKGEPVRPFVQKEMYRIAVAEPFRDQLGRIEFWRCSGKLEVV